MFLVIVEIVFVVLNSYFSPYRKFFKFFLQNLPPAGNFAAKLNETVRRLEGLNFLPKHFFDSVSMKDRSAAAAAVAAAADESQPQASAAGGFFARMGTFRSSKSPKMKRKKQIVFPQRVILIFFLSLEISLFFLHAGSGGGIYSLAGGPGGFVIWMGTGYTCIAKT